MGETDDANWSQNCSHFDSSSDVLKYHANGEPVAVAGNRLVLDYDRERTAIIEQ